MIGILILTAYLALGVWLANSVFYRQQRLVRLWLGLCAGLILLMWLPTLFAFFLGFTRTATLLGLPVAAAMGTAAQKILGGRPHQRRWTDMPAWLLPALVIPLVLLGGYLQYTHTIRPSDGALFVGQSTYGDLCLHLGIATSLRNAPYPPEYSILPGALLGYPFLADSMATSLLLFGTGLSQAFVITGTLMLALVFSGFVLLCWRLTRSAAATVVATLLMFMNGGLGFIYALDGVGRDASAFNAIFTGFYKTPTNQPDLNLRWVNVICDMMIPQRTLLCGWMALLPALYLLLEAIEGGTAADFITLGIWAGTLPMIHTHSFLGLGLLSAGVMASCAIHAPAGARLRTLGRFLLYGASAVLLAAPQLLTWAVPQTLKGGSIHFLFNWVNNRGNGRLIDGYVWFWVKNVGLIWLLMVPAALFDDRGPHRAQTLEPGTDTRAARRALGLGALCIYVVAELIVFQPNVYDNNKLFYVAFMVMMPAVGLYLVRLFERLQGLRGRYLLAAAFMLVSLLSGALSIAREVVSNYRLLGPSEVAAAQYIEKALPEDAVFLTGDQHNNAVAALTGRHIVCGTGSYLYFHGIDYAAQASDERQMLEDPAGSAALFGRYGVSYAYISSYERMSFDVDEAWFERHGERVFDMGDVTIYALPTPAEGEWTD
ncbi:MAG: hypothetical protein IJJ45_00905 [Clostridia bacterium]|nr:hypothetical protein [Clostridia bacterium]